MNEKTIPSKQPNLVLGLFVLIAGSAYLIYLMLPSLLMKVNSYESRGVVKSINDHHLEYSYYNKFENQEYTMSRYISVPQYTTLSKDSAFNVLYPNHFPEEVIIVGIDKEKPITLFILFLIFLLYGVLKVFQQLYIRFKNP